MPDKARRIKSIPQMFHELHSADDAKTIRKYEYTIACIYAFSLLCLAAVGSYVARHLLERQNWVNYFLDSLVLLSAGIAFSALPWIDLKRGTYILSSALTLLVFIFVTVRFYYLIGPAVWTFAFIQCMLTMFWTSRLKLYSLGLAIAISGVYIIYRYTSVAPYRIGYAYYITQASLFSFLAVYASAYNRLTVDRHDRLESALRRAVEQKNELTALYEAKRVSEKELKNTLDRLHKNKELIIQQEKLAAIGQLAAGVAHEINNPLGYVSSNFETCRTYYERFKEINRSLEEYIGRMSPEELEKNAELLGKLNEMKEKENLDLIFSELDEIHRDIEEGLSRIGDIVQGIKNFARTDRDVDFTDLDLNKSIRSALLMLKNEIKHTARVVELLENIPIIKGKRNHIEQVLVNIILNAAQAIKAKNPDAIGTIIIGTELVNDVVVCRIEDNGIGISEENLRKIFNPFFSTKPVGQGTGLGLSIAYDIVVNEHGGRLFCESTENVGSRFFIELPAAR